MGFRYQKRVNLGKGLGLNIGKKSISTSYRTRHGTIGSRGFSLRTGIPGLSYRSSWSKSKEGPLILVVFGLVYIASVVIYNVALFLIFLVKFTYFKLIAHDDETDISE